MQIQVDLSKNFRNPVGGGLSFATRMRMAGQTPKNTKKSRNQTLVFSLLGSISIRYQITYQLHIYIHTHIKQNLINSYCFSLHPLFLWNISFWSPFDPAPMKNQFTRSVALRLGGLVQLCRCVALSGLREYAEKPLSQKLWIGGHENLWLKHGVSWLSNIGDGVNHG